MTSLLPDWILFGIHVGLVYRLGSNLRLLNSESTPREDYPMKKFALRVTRNAALASTAMWSLSGLAHAQTAASTPSKAVETESGIVVTGTRIRGIAPVGAAVIKLDQTAIKDTGIAAVTDILKSVPQISNIGSDEGRTGSGANGQTFNIAQSSGVNLRGLGTQATLTLINGRRAAPGGVFGNLFDPSAIPAIAIGGIEVLADGSSAIYGSDALAGVVNLGLRKNVKGLEVQGRYTIADNYNAQRYSGIAGHSWGSGQIMIAGEYARNTSLAAADRANLFIGADQPITQIASAVTVPVGYSNTTPLPNFTLNGTAYAVNRDGTVTAGVKNIWSQWSGSNYLPESRRFSLVGTIDQNISDGIKFYSQFHYSKREYKNLTGRGTGGGAGNSTTALRVGAANPYMVQFLARNGLVGTPGPLTFGYLEQFGPNDQSGFNSNWLAVGGLSFDLPHDFKADFSVSHGENREHRFTRNVINNAALATALASSSAATAFNPFGATPAAVLNAIRATNDQTTGYNLTVAAAKIDGGLFSTAGGSVKIAAGLEYAWNSEFIYNVATANSVPDSSGAPVIQDTGRKMNVYSAFAEVVIPIFGAGNAIPGFKRLDFSAAGRYDHYNVMPCRVTLAAATSQGAPCASTTPKFDTFNPKFGITWKPTNDLTVRASYGTSFRYNLLVSDLNGAPLYASLTNYADAVFGSTTAVRRGGGSPDVKPETAKTWTFGLEYKPEWAHGLELTATYFDVQYKNIIGAPDAIFGGNNATTSAQYASYIQRRPSLITPGADDTAFNALIASVLGSNFYTGSATVPNTPAGIASVKVYVEQRNQNIGTILTKGIDFTASYRFDLGKTNWMIGAVGTKYFKYQRAFVTGQTPAEVADLIDNPTSYRLRGQLGFATGPIRTNTFINYTPSYTNTYDSLGGIAVSTGGFGTTVAAQTTVDVNFNLDLGKLNDAAAFKGLTFGIDIINLFGATPAYARVGAPIIQNFDTSTGSALGQTVSFRLAKKF
jgi:iron complex outermembrane recepter protein